MQARFTDRNGTPIPEDARLYRILVTETAYLIWKVRCQRVIEENNIPKSQTEIHNRWVAAINERIQLDCRVKAMLLRRGIHPFRRVSTEMTSDIVHTESGIPIINGKKRNPELFHAEESGALLRYSSRFMR